MFAPTPATHGPRRLCLASVWSAAASWVPTACRPTAHDDVPVVEAADLALSRWGYSGGVHAGPRESPALTGEGARRGAASEASRTPDVVAGTVVMAAGRP